LLNFGIYQYEAVHHRPFLNACCLQIFLWLGEMKTAKYECTQFWCV